MINSKPETLNSKQTQKLKHKIQNFGFEFMILGFEFV